MKTPPQTPRNIFPGHAFGSLPSSHVDQTADQRTTYNRVTIRTKRAGVWGALQTLLIGAAAAGTSYVIVRLLDSGDSSP